MNRKNLWIIGAALALIAFAIVGCKEGERAATGGAEIATDGSEAVAISVTEEGFVPKEIHVKAGQPVTLAVTRQTDRTCATELVLKEYGINRKLPLKETVRISFTPKNAGQLTYACGMDMFKGIITVE